jgi:hypothetical protein
MAQVKTFFSTVVDEYGGVFEQAFVAVRAFSKVSQDTGYSEECEGEYLITSELEAITYKVNYWYSEKTMSEGRRSRPLKVDNAGVLSDVLTVDLESPEVVEILATDMDPIERVLRAIKADAVRKFS